MGARPFQADHQQHQVGANREGNRSDQPASPSGEPQYVNFMSIKNWDSDGRWTTNFSAIAVSPDNGEHWGVYPGTVRTPHRTASRESRTAREIGEFPRAWPGDPYLYWFGTPSGRGGPGVCGASAAGLCAGPHQVRILELHRESMGPKQSGGRDAGDPRPVGEMSAQYNTYLKQYLMLYCNGANDVVARTAPAPQGPWSPEQTLVRSAEIPGGVYTPYLHPWSMGRELYFNLSLWSAYNVMLMKAVLP